MLRVAIFVASFVAIGAFAGVSVAETGPMADAGLDQTVTVNTEVQLDGTGSTHPDGTIEGYEWEIRTPGGEETTPECPDCERSQFTPTVPGRYEVTLTVNGTSGVRSNDTLFVYVQDAGPSVELSGDTSPEPDEPTTYRASAESQGTELEDVAWAIEDEVVSVRSLDGSTDDDELTFAFTDDETHRVQVVVRDTNGRTAYDQLLVRPGDDEPTVSPSWSDVDTSEPDCSDADYISSNPDECISSEPTPTESDDGPTVGPEFVQYQTDGYQNSPFEGVTGTDSSYMGMTTNEVGLDGGGNAHWRESLGEKVYDSTVGEASRFLFGQEEKSVSCQFQSKTVQHSTCAQKVSELENAGETTNANSPTKTGAYSEYGLTDGKRVRGTNPTNLEEGQSVEVTVVIQQEEDGIIDETIQSVKPSAERVRDVVGGLNGRDDDSDSSDNGGTDSRTQDTSGSSSSSSISRSSSIGGSTGTINPGLGSNSATDSTTSDPDTSSEESDVSSPSTKVGVGLVR